MSRVTAALALDLPFSKTSWGLWVLGSHFILMQVVCDTLHPATHILEWDWALFMPAGIAA